MVYFHTLASFQCKDTALLFLIGLWLADVGLVAPVRTDLHRDVVHRLCIGQIEHLWVDDDRRPVGVLPIDSWS